MINTHCTVRPNHSRSFDASNNLSPKLLSVSIDDLLNVLNNNYVLLDPV